MQRREVEHPRYIAGNVRSLERGNHKEIGAWLDSPDTGRVKAFGKSSP